MAAVVETAGGPHLRPKRLGKEVEEVEENTVELW